MGERLQVLIVYSLVVEQLDDLFGFLLVAIRNFVLCRFVSAEEFHDSIKTFLLIEVLERYLEANALYIVQVFTPSHTASKAEVVSGEVLKLLEWYQRLITCDIYNHFLKVFLRPKLGFSEPIEFHHNLGAAVSD